MRTDKANQSFDCPKNDNRCHQGEGQKKRVSPRRKLWPRLSLGPRSGRRILLLAGQRESFLSETGDGLIDKYRRRAYLYGTPPANFIDHALTISAGEYESTPYGRSSLDWRASRVCKRPRSESRSNVGSRSNRRIACRNKPLDRHSQSNSRPHSGRGCDHAPKGVRNGRAYRLAQSPNIDACSPLGHRTHRTRVEQSGMGDPHRQLRFWHAGSNHAGTIPSDGGER